MITEFSDNTQSGAHSKFQAWRRKNPDGFFLNQKTQEAGMLHRVSCRHPDDDAWESADHGGASLTKKLKVCSVDRAELRAWAKQRGVSLQDCSHCIKVSTHAA